MFDAPFLGVDGWLKRVEDLLIGIVAVIVTAPLMLAIAVGVKLSSPGPLLFRRRRYRRDDSALRGTPARPAAAIGMPNSS